jgi:hypothetical protein
MTSGGTYVEYLKKCSIANADRRGRRGLLVSNTGESVLSKVNTKNGDRQIPHKVISTYD